MTFPAAEEDSDLKKALALSLLETNDPVHSDSGSPDARSPSIDLSADYDRQLAMAVAASLETAARERWDIGNPTFGYQNSREPLDISPCTSQQGSAGAIAGDYVSHGGHPRAMMADDNAAFTNLPASEVLMSLRTSAAEAVSGLPSARGRGTPVSRMDSPEGKRRRIKTKHAEDDDMMEGVSDAGGQLISGDEDEAMPLAAVMKIHDAEGGASAEILEVSTETTATAWGMASTAVVTPYAAAPQAGVGAKEDANSSQCQRCDSPTRGAAVRDEAATMVHQPQLRFFYINQKVFWRDGGVVHVARVKSVDMRSSPLLYTLELFLLPGEGSFLSRPITVQSTAHDMYLYLEPGESVWYRMRLPDTDAVAQMVTGPCNNHVPAVPAAAVAAAAAAAAAASCCAMGAAVRNGEVHCAPQPAAAQVSSAGKIPVAPSFGNPELSNVSRPGAWLGRTVWEEALVLYFDVLQPDPRVLLQLMPRKAGDAAACHSLTVSASIVDVELKHEVGESSGTAQEPMEDDGFYGSFPADDAGGVGGCEITRVT